jgi:hypothetical protein
MEPTGMTAEQASIEQTLPGPKSPCRRRRWIQTLFALLLVYLAVAYFIMPIDWRWYVRRHPSLEDILDITHTGSGIPGDPLNVALIGTESEVKGIMRAAGWYAADPLGLRSDLRIAADTVLKRPDDQAPVSNLYLLGRKEDLAFEQPVGGNPRKRNHVRFWRTDKVDDGRPVWIGSATYDERVGFSHTTGQITHHIAADVDAERDYLLGDLDKTAELSETYFVDGFHKTLEGRNGGGDPWHTDGRLAVGVIAVNRE